MGLFKDVLKSDESVFKNEIALDYDFLPKLLPYREDKQREIAAAINPLLMEKNGRNVFVHGPPGIGKTAALRSVLRDLEEETDDVIPIYINCWNKNTTYKILLEICDALDFKFTQNKRTEELFKVVKQLLNRKAAVFVFDEVDKVEDLDFLYTILEEIYKKSIILITNYKEWLANLDERIKSRLPLNVVEFQTYNAAETKGILKQRMGYAFVPGVWDETAFQSIAAKTAEIKDIRTGLYLLKEAGNHAEEQASKKIEKTHAEKALSTLQQFHSKDDKELADDEQIILNLIKDNSGNKIGDLFKFYQEKGGKQTYKTFQRRIDKLEKGKYITTHKTEGGKEGNTTLIKYGEVKKLTEF